MATNVLHATALLLSQLRRYKMSQASLFRSSKTRSTKSQDQLLSQSLKYKQVVNPNTDQSDIYECTYGIPMPNSSVQLLQPLVSGLVGGMPKISTDVRDTHTIGLWTIASSAVYRCCFIQPELSSATACAPAYRYRDAVLSTHIVSEEIGGATSSRVTKHSHRIQLSGRMVPYVVDHMNIRCDWSFVNISKSRFLFICTDENGSHLASFSKKSMEMLKPHTPDNVAYVFEAGTSAYKITARPPGVSRADEANKNTCMLLYADGAFKATGKPDAMKDIGAGFRHAILSIASSPSWPLFVKSLAVLS